MKRSSAWQCVEWMRRLAWRRSARRLAVGASGGAAVLPRAMLLPHARVHDKAACTPPCATRPREGSGGSSRLGAACRAAACMRCTAAAPEGTGACPQCCGDGTAPRQSQRCRVSVWPVRSDSAARCTHIRHRTIHSEPDADTHTHARRSGRSSSGGSGSR
eukprot:TRINITY_DN803_c0_g1_i1.p2 TRINITY_DN803_c0_g1~~TRINITY_DN803_c0_g1_i1.p2  ORF type:complete len:160 (-),score=33.11 TRINITY_DN803_c0_g1_i1:60-539(-)